MLADVTAALNAFLDPLSGGPAAVAAMTPAPAPTSLPTPGQTTVAATNTFGAVAAVGPSAATPIPGVQLLAATQPSVPQATPTPLPPPGWPFGRSVYRAEVLQVIQSVAGVDHVESLELLGRRQAPSCGNLCVGPLQLVAPVPTPSPSSERKASEPIMRVPCSNPLAIRINHVQGERLRAADLQDELGVESWMRQLHMIGLHDTWGIALGLEATAEEARDAGSASPPAWLMTRGAARCCSRPRTSRPTRGHPTRARTHRPRSTSC